MQTWKRLIPRYLSEKRGAGWSDGTLGASARWLKKFLLWCDGRGLRGPAQVTAAHVEEYRQHLLCVPARHARYYKLNSIDQALRVLRQFFCWAVDRGHVLFSPTRDLVLPRIETRTPLLSAAEVRHVLEAAQSAPAPLGLRDRALVETLYRTGMRRGECLRLRLEDVRMEERIIRVTGRRGGRELPMPQELADTLGRYLQESRPLLTGGGGCDALFLSARGTPFNNGALAEMLKRLSARVGFRVTAHRFRHACADHLLEDGAEFAQVGEMLGLRHVRSAERYTHRATAALARQRRGTRPRGRRLTHFSSLVDGPSEA